MVSGEQSGVEEQMDKVSDDLVSEFLKTHRFVI